MINASVVNVHPSPSVFCIEEARRVTKAVTIYRRLVKTDITDADCPGNASTKYVDVQVKHERMPKPPEKKKSCLIYSIENVA